MYTYHTRPRKVYEMDARYANLEGACVLQTSIAPTDGRRNAVRATAASAIASDAIDL
jgi:hypothetical protein